MKFIIIVITIFPINYFGSFSYLLNNSIFSSSKGSTEKTNISELSVINHPALLSLVDSACISGMLSYSKFNLPELSPFVLSYATKVSENLSSGISFAGIGNNLYNEFTGSAGIAYSSNKLINIGISADFGRVGIKDYGNRYIFSLNVSSIIALSNAFSAGFSLSNILGNENLAEYQRYLVLGFGYQAMKDLSFDLSANVVINKTSGLSFSTKYQFSPDISARLGLLTNPEILDLEVRTCLSNSFSLLLGLEYHQRLGFSNQFGIGYYF